MIISGYGIIFIPFMIMLSAVFQPIWNIPSRFYYKSFYSPLDWVLNIQLGTDTEDLRDSNNSLLYVFLFFVVFSLSINIDVYMFKIYPDVLAYWGFIYVLIISGLIVSRVKFLRTSNSSNNVVFSFVCRQYINGLCYYTIWVLYSLPL